jgi:hypothetical protein
MKFDKANSKVKVVKSVDGLVSAIFDHEIKESKATVVYTGPKISEEEWNKVLAFFKFSYDTTHSEAQVRLFVNPKLGLWRAWAFPQICGTGMTTKEIEEETPERTAQRARFNDAEGWMPFGTVHHHCAAGAFQSGTDEHDETRQDGLHITVGKLNEKKYDIHCRFYISGNRFDPDMSLFWEVGDITSEVPEWARHYLPATLKNDIARSSMCIPPPEGTTFPDEWKANLIEHTPQKVVGSFPFQGSQPRFQNIGGDWQGGSFGQQMVVRRCGSSFSTTFNTPRDLDTATRAAFEDFPAVKDLEAMHELFAQALDIAEENEALALPIEDLISHCRSCDVTLDAFVDHLGRLLEVKEAKQEQAEMAAEGGGVPDWDGPTWNHTGY